MPAAVAKPVLPPLQTPKTASFPSEISSPLPSSLSAIKKEDDLRTPITPPTAYTDFLKTLTPILSSASPRSAIPRTFSFEDVSAKSTPRTEPSTTTSATFPCRCDSHKSPPASATGAPSSPYFRPRSARSPGSCLRRLRIPPSPLGSPANDSPRSSSLSQMRSPFSPADWSLDKDGHRYIETPRSGPVRPVSVRSVVTRTVTYKRTPSLDAAPKGKKRKMSDGTLTPPTPTVVLAT